MRILLFHSGKITSKGHAYGAVWEDLYDTFTSRILMFELFASFIDCNDKLNAIWEYPLEK